MPRRMTKALHEVQQGSGLVMLRPSVTCPDIMTTRTICDTSESIDYTYVELPLSIVSYSNIIHINGDGMLYTASNWQEPWQSSVSGWLLPSNGICYARHGACDVRHWAMCMPQMFEVCSVARSGDLPRLPLKISYPSQSEFLF